MIFPRRDLQRILFENERLLTPAQSAEFVNRLRKRSSHLPTEWEATLLNALSRVAEVQWERPLASGKKPDLQVEESGRGLSFVADITTVSDKNYEQENPVLRFLDRVSARIRDRGLTSDGFDVQIGEQISPDRRITCLIPRTTSAHVEFQNELDLLIEEIKNNPRQRNFARRIRVPPEVSIVVRYARGTTLFGASHISYNVPHALDANPLYHALEKKARMLRKCPAQTLTGIIVCDGDCDLVHSSMNMQISPRDVVAECFRRYPTLGFVVILAVKQDSDLMSYRVRTVLKGSFYANEATDKSNTDKVADLVSAALRHLPIPVMTPKNALLRLASPSARVGVSYVGGYTVTDNSIKISSRALHEVLAGHRTASDFAKDHNWGPGPQCIPNPFQHFLSERRPIEKLEIEPGTDDDWIKFTFGARDPARSDFRLRKDCEEETT